MDDVYMENLMSDDPRLIDHVKSILYPPSTLPYNFTTHDSSDLSMVIYQIIDYIFNNKVCIALILYTLIQ